MRSAALALAAGAFAATTLASAQAASEPDPDSAEAHRRALEALPRAERRAISAEERTIVGMPERTIAGRSEDISGLMRDLGAEVRGREMRIALSADVLFDFDKAELKPEAAASLSKVAAVLRSQPDATAVIEGHTDGKGNDAYNQKLSEQRAETVRRWLAQNGATMKIASRGHGKKKPVAPNTTKDGKDDPEGRQKNRRVEIVVQGVDPTAAQAARR